MDLTSRLLCFPNLSPFMWMLVRVHRPLWNGHNGKLDLLTRCWIFQGESFEDLQKMFGEMVGGNGASFDLHDDPTSTKRARATSSKGNAAKRSTSCRWCMNSTGSLFYPFCLSYPFGFKILVDWGFSGKLGVYWGPVWAKMQFVLNLEGLWWC